MTWIECSKALPSAKKEVEVIYEAKFIEKKSSAYKRRRVIGLGSFDPTSGWEIVNKETENVGVIKVIFWSDLSEDTQGKLTDES